MIIKNETNQGFSKATQGSSMPGIFILVIRKSTKSIRKAMNRNWRNQKAHPALKAKTGNKEILQIDKIQ